LDYAKILNSQENDYCFLLERTGTWDEIKKGNVNESLITQFDYIILDLLRNTPLVLKEVYTNFIELFHVESKQDSQKLRKIFNFLIKDLIFRRYIIEN